MKIPALIITCLLFFTCTSASAQSSDSHFSKFWHDLESTTREAFNPIDYDIRGLVGYAAFTGILIMGTDMEVHEEYGIEKENTPFGLPRKLTQIGNFYDRPGPAYFTLGLLGILHMTDAIVHIPDVNETTVLITKSIMITGLLTTTLKILIGRARPYKAKGAQSFKPLNFKFNTGYMSMPSGHTSSIFAIMTVVAKQYDHWYVQIPAYTMAASVAFQRLNDQMHWISDLLIGGTIGYLVAHTLVNKSTKPSFLIKPVVSSRGIGLDIYF